MRSLSDCDENPHASAFVYGYFAGVGSDACDWYFRPGVTAGIIPTNDGVANVFVVKNGELTTPATQVEMRDPAVRDATAYERSNVLPGVTRQAILDLAQQEQISVQARAIDGR